VTVRSLAALGTLALLMAACATPTPYQPMTLEGGYTHTRLGANMLNVVFQGNAHTPWQTAENYALYRAAELSLESGFDYFVVVGGSSAASPVLAGGRPSYPSNTDGSPPMVSLIVRGFSGEKPPEPAFNARDVLNALAPTIKRPE
jgi:hypothetical protein